MKQNILFNSIMILLLLTGCSGNRSGNETELSEVESTPVEKMASPSVVETRDVFYINNDKNEEIASISFGDETFIRYKKNTQFIKSCNSADKCKYKSADKSLVYEIKYKDDGFKLRNENGQLIWKIKVREDKIKIADNEEMENVYEIKRAGEKADITYNGDQIASVDFGSTSVPVLVKGKNEQFTISGKSKELASGVMGIDGIDEEHRVLIFTEIVKFPL